MVLRQLDSHMQKNEVEPLPYIQKCKTSKRIKELIAKIIKFLEEHIELSNGLIDTTPQHKQQKKKIN